MNKSYIITVHYIESNDWEYYFASTTEQAIEIAHSHLKEYYQSLMDNGWEQDQPVTGFEQLQHYLGADCGYLDVQITEKSFEKIKVF
jgi:hypothetical protein